MKKIHYFVSIVLSFLLNTGYGQNEPGKSCLIAENDGIAMVKHFRNKYASSCNDHTTCGLQRQGWLSKEVVAAMARLLSDNSKGVDGYRIYFTIEPEDREMFSCNDHKKGISFTIVPTRDSAIMKTATSSTHINVWGRLIQISDTIGYTINVGFNVEKEKSIQLRSRFDSIYRKEGIADKEVDSLSKSVWYSKTCIEEIYSDLSNDLNAHGLLILPGAYSDSLRNVNYGEGQKYANQSTIILVTADRRRHPIWKQEPKIASSASPYNHGELCPQKCPPPEN